MPCHAAMSDKFLKISSGDEVEKTLKTMKKAKAEFAVVQDDDGTFAGLFQIQTLFQNLLPVSIAMPDNLQANIRVAAAPGIAKRLNKVHPLTIEQFMDRDAAIVQPETPLWVAVKMAAQQGGPIVVIDAETNNPVGVMSMQSILDELNRLKKS